MRFGKRGSRSRLARRLETFRPRLNALEDRLLLAIDVGGVTPPGLPNVATVPYGVDLAGGSSNQGAGYRVTNVGDLNGDGFDDFVIGAPTVTNNGNIGVGFGNTSTVYVVFGSRAVGNGNFDWNQLNLIGQRVGDLSQLGNSQNAQQNPITGATGFPYEGIKIVTGQTPASQLGASVSVVQNVDGRGTTGILIGAPGARDLNGNNSGTGRAYLIYANANLLNVPNKVLDLDNPNQNSGVPFLTFVNSATNSGTGRSVAGLNSLFGTGFNDIAIGAPTASIGGLVNTGAVYVVNGLALNTPRTATINLATVGQTNGTAGVIFAGSQVLGQAGFSVASAGDVTGAVTNPGNIPIDDLLIGAPQSQGGTGAAYLVYGDLNLASLATLSNGVNLIPLSSIGATLPGAVFNGTATGDLTGYSVAAAGDFSQDGFADFMIGSPGFQGRGEETVVFGQPVGTSGPVITGSIGIGTLPSATIPAVNFIGAAAGDQAGYSATQVGQILANGPAGEIAIGAPTFGTNGAVYLIPYNADLLGNFSLAAAEQQPIAGTLITLTNTPVVAPAFFGASVSSRPNVRGKFTADQDFAADLIVGAPGYGVVAGRGLDGGVFILEGIDLPVQTPVNTSITTQIGVGQPFGPFIVSATTPNALQIYVFSNANVNPTFDPVRDIDPKTIVINGVAFPNATIAKDPVDENKDGIEDAIITITPRSNIGLTTATPTLTIRGRTLAGSPNANRSFSGSASITVSGSGTNGGGTGGAAFSTFNNVGFVQPTTFTTQFGPDTFVPTTYNLSRLDYKPIPRSVAYHQYIPSGAFRERTVSFFHPSQAHNTQVRQAENILGNKYNHTFTLPHGVFTRSKFKPGHTVQFTHKVPVIPTNLQTERFKPTPLKRPILY